MASGSRSRWAAVGLLACLASGPAASHPDPSPAEKVALGERLFFDTRLSGDNQMSCATCHLPEKAFTDGLRQARGAGGATLPRNTQSLLNLGLYTSYFWDGRASSLEDQALAPIRAADEMNQDLAELIQELGAVPEYVERFQKVFGTGVTAEGIAGALAAFERTLVTRNSRFDRFLAGDTQALSEQEREGWQLFQEAGCIRCHSGSGLTDNKFYRLGVENQDRGRGGVTRDQKELYAFRTPSLRDVARTGPYMHNGAFATLEEVVQFYYRSTPTAAGEGLGVDWEPLLERSFSEIAPIVAFLEALTGEGPPIKAH